MILEHRHLIVRATISKPISDPEKAKDFLKRIISAVNMKLAVGFEDNAVISFNNKFKKAKRFIFDCVAKILGLKVEANPISYYCNLEGNEGLTAVAILETSHCAMHIWDKNDPAVIEFDLYSCADFSIEQIMPIINELGIIDSEYWFVNRDTGLELISSGKLSTN